MARSAQKRRIESLIEKDLAKKMVFVAGPRQCGKTTVAKRILTRVPGTYYNWDIDSERKVILAGRLDASSRLWVLDEIHKYRRWRNWLKGLFDEHAGKHSILVTGSAKLDLFSRGGDSLQGRYYLFRLHPLTFSECVGTEFPKDSPNEIFELPLAGPSEKAGNTILNDLLKLGGFPEPFFSGSSTEAARWRLLYGTRLVRDDVRDLELARDLDRIELLFDRLPQTVGSPLSLNNLREDLGVAFETVRSWVSVFDNLYATFRTPPFGAPKIKAVKKEQKLYFWDWARIENEGTRYENLIGAHLLRFAHWCADVWGIKAELRYLRDVNGHEIDFLMLKNHQPWFAVEAKLSEQALDPNLKYFLERMRIPMAFQVHLHGSGDWNAPSINGTKVRMTSAARFLANLP